MTPIHVLDFEGHRDYGIIEYGRVTMEGREIVACETALCRPHGAIHAADIRVHGIRQKDAADREPFEDCRSQFFDLRKTGPLCAHHASTEHGLLRNYWPYPPFSPDFVARGEDIAEWGPWIDTCRLAAAAWPGMRDYKLGNLIDALQLHESIETLAEAHCPPQRRRFHCALYDTLAAALLLQCLMDDLGTTEVSDLIRLSQPGYGQAVQGELF